MTGALARVLVRPPLAEDVEHWRAFGWHAAPDHPAAALEHEVLCSILEDAGAEVVVLDHHLVQGHLGEQHPLPVVGPGSMLGEPKDAVAILAIVLLNGIVGAVHEFRAQQAMAGIAELLDRVAPPQP